MRWHAEGKDLIFKTIVLEILIEMVLMAVQNKQSIPLYLVRLCMYVEMLQLLKTKCIVCPAVLRD